MNGLKLYESEKSDFLLSVELYRKEKTDFFSVKPNSRVIFPVPVDWTF